MKKIFLIFILFIFSLNAYSQQIPSVHYYQSGITYKANSLVSKDGIIYKALVQTINTPPHADWEIPIGDTEYTFDSPLNKDASNNVTLDQTNLAKLNESNFFHGDTYMNNQWYLYQDINNTSGQYIYMRFDGFDATLMTSPSPLNINWTAGTTRIGYLYNKEFWSDFPKTTLSIADYYPQGNDILVSKGFMLDILDSYETRLARTITTTTYTPEIADVGKTIIMSGSSIVMDDNLLTIGYQNNILNNSGSVVTWDFATNGQTAIQGTIPDLQDGKYAYIQYIANNTWSVIVGGDTSSGGSIIADLNDLNDVSIISPVIGDGLLYDAANSKWINQKYSYNYLTDRPVIPTDNSQLANGQGYITTQTDNQTLSFTSPTLEISNGNNVNLSSLIQDLTDYETKAARYKSTSLDYMTIAEDVGKKILMTSSKITLNDNGLTPGYQINILNRSGGLITIDNNTYSQTTLQPTTDISNGKYAYFELVSDNTWSLVIGSDSSVSGATTLAGLTDTDISSPGNGQALTYNTTSTKWEPTTLGSGVTQLDELSDVTSAATTDKYALIANGSSYIGRAIVEADISDLGPYNNYSHPNNPGNYHMPAGGNVGNVIVNTGDGIGTWQSKVLTDNQTAAEVLVNTTAFSNNLSGSDSDVQTALETIDALNFTISGTETNLTWNDAQHQIHSSTETNGGLILPFANNSIAGLMSTTLYNNVQTNNLKVTNATHTGEVTGSTVLTIADNAVESVNIKDNTITESDLYNNTTWHSGDYLTWNGISYEWSAPGGEGTTYTAGNGLDLNSTEFSHHDTSIQSSIDNSNNFVIQDLTLDTYGHLTAIGSKEITLAGLGWTAPPLSDYYNKWYLAVDSQYGDGILTNNKVTFESGDNISLNHFSFSGDHTITISSSDQYVGTVTKVETSGPLTGGPITTSGTIGINKATTTTDGYLSSIDYNTFASKTSNTGTVTSVGTTGPLQGTITTTGTLSITQAGISTDGYLSSADYNLFKSKTSNVGTITDVIAGNGISGGVTNGVATLSLLEGASVGGLQINSTTIELGSLNGNWDAGSQYTIKAAGFYEGSLRSLKMNIQPFIESGLELINGLDIVSYDKKDGKIKNKIGILIDESPEEFANEEQTAVDLYKTIFVQAKAIQELSAKLDALEKRIEILENNK